MGTDIAGRINEYIKSERISISELGRRTGTPRATAYGYLKGARRIPADFLLRLLESYPDLSADWLMLGRGSMDREWPTGLDDHVTAIPYNLHIKTRR